MMVIMKEDKGKAHIRVTWERQVQEATWRRIGAETEVSQRMNDLGGLSLEMKAT
jgi:hypothetical protein